MNWRTSDELFVRSSFPWVLGVLARDNNCCAPCLLSYPLCLRYPVHVVLRTVSCMYKWWTSVLRLTQQRRVVRMCGSDIRHPHVNFWLLVPCMFTVFQWLVVLIVAVGRRSKLLSKCSSSQRSPNVVEILKNFKYFLVIILQYNLI